MVALYWTDLCVWSIRLLSVNCCVWSTWCKHIETESQALPDVPSPWCQHVMTEWSTVSMYGCVVVSTLWRNAMSCLEPGHLRVNTLWKSGTLCLGGMSCLIDLVSVKCCWMWRHVWRLLDLVSVDLKWMAAHAWCLTAFVSAHCDWMAGCAKCPVNLVPVYCDLMAPHVWRLAACVPARILWLDCKSCQW